MTTKTKLDQLIAEAITHEAFLAEMPPRGLTADAFLALALQYAETTEKRLKEVESKLTDVTPSCLRFVRRIEKITTEGGFPTPYREWGKLERAYGSEGLLGEAHAVGVTIPELYCLGVRNACERRPQRFGEVEDLEQYDAEFAKHRTAANHVYAQMLNAYTSEDLVLDSSKGVTNAERDRGLVKVYFKRAFGVALTGDWPERLTREVARLTTAALRKKTKPVLRAKAA